MQQPQSTQNSNREVSAILPPPQEVSKMRCRRMFYRGIRTALLLPLIATFLTLYHYIPTNTKKPFYSASYSPASLMPQNITKEKHEPKKPHVQFLGEFKLKDESSQNVEVSQILPRRSNQETYSNHDPKDLSGVFPNRPHSINNSSLNLTSDVMQNNKTDSPVYKIQLKHDNGMDYGFDPITISMELLKKTLEHTRQKALAYQENIEGNSHTNNIINNNNKSQKQKIQSNQVDEMQKRVTPKGEGLPDIKKTSTVPKSPSVKSSMSDPEKCQVKITLDSCNCVRYLSPQGIPCPGSETKQSTILGSVRKSLGESTCSDWATLRGGKQKVVSFSLFGKFPSSYHRGAQRLIQRVKEVYPGWTVRLYHDLDFYKTNQREWMCSLACTHPHLDFCSARHLPGDLGDMRWTIGTTWRFAVMGDPLVQRYLVRDTDSPILQREVDAVNEWMNSDKCFHVMRDNPSHNQGMMGGTWGGCDFWHPEAMTRLRDTVFRWSRSRVRSPSMDQNNVVEILWPVFKKSHMAHDSYSCQHFPGSRPFPTQRENMTFVGMRAYRKSFQDDRITTPCPVKCRPRRHKDWEYC